MTELEAWPFNRAAVLAMAALATMLAGCFMGLTSLIIIGAWTMAVTCTSQICIVIKEARS